MAARDLAAAQSQLDRVLQAAPNDADALKVQGDLLYAQKGDAEAAPSSIARRWPSAQTTLLPTLR